MDGCVPSSHQPTDPVAIGCCHIRIPIPIFPNPMLFGLVKFIYYKGQVIFFHFAFLLYITFLHLQVSREAGM
jgi:hypothetical protein